MESILILGFTKVASQFKHFQKKCNFFLSGMDDMTHFGFALFGFIAMPNVVVHLRISISAKTNVPLAPNSIISAERGGHIGSILPCALNG